MALSLKDPLQPLGYSLICLPVCATFRFQIFQAVDGLCGSITIATTAFVIQYVIDTGGVPIQCKYIAFKVYTLNSCQNYIVFTCLQLCRAPQS